MPIVTDNYTLSLTQDNRVLRVRCSQNDTSRQVNFTIYNNGTLFTIPTGLSVSVHGIKQDGNIFTKSCTYSGSVVTLVLGTQITNTVGISVAELVFTNSSGGKIGTSNFIFQVESDPLLRGTIDVTEETPTEYIYDLISMVEALSARVNNIITPSGEASLSEVVDARLSGYSGTTYQNLKARIDADFAALGNTKADKSDTYTKEEVDDAIDNITITTDETLSVPGAAADAKKTGDAISEINGSLGERITDLLTTADVSGVSITIGKEIRNSDGAVITNAKTAIITKYVTRYRAIEMTGDTYQQKVVLYNQNNQYDGLLSDYTNDIVSIPKSALYFRCTFKRKDGADMTSADIQAIRDAMVWLKQTDDSLSVPNIPADSSATGIRLTNVENRVSALEDATIPVDVKQALLRLLKKATYTSADMSADIRTVQDWVGIQVHYIDVSIKGNAPGTSDGSKKITATLAYDNGLSAVFEVGASIYKVTDTGTHDRFRFYGISADLDVNDPSDFAQITVDRIADATTVSGLDSMSEYTVDNTVTQYKIIFVYLRDDTTDYNPNLVVEEVAE